MWNDGSIGTRSHLSGAIARQGSPDRTRWTMTDRPAGLRERKKQRTRSEISAAALTLIAERGLAEVRVEDICEAADVGRSTFFRYFDSKESAFVEGVHASRIESVTAELVQRPADEPPFEALQQAALTMASQWRSFRDDMVLEARLRSESATVRAWAAESSERWMTEIAAALSPRWRARPRTVGGDRGRVHRHHPDRVRPVDRGRAASTIRRRSCDGASPPCACCRAPADQCSGSVSTTSTEHRARLTISAGVALVNRPCLVRPRFPMAIRSALTSRRPRRDHVGRIPWDRMDGHGPGRRHGDRLQQTFGVAVGDIGAIRIGPVDGIDEMHPRLAPGPGRALGGTRRAPSSGS